MPWVHGDDYMKERKAELKNLLILRHLSDSGTKAKMVSRLRAHDDHQSVYRLQDTLTGPGHLLIRRTVHSSS